MTNLKKKGLSEMISYVLLIAIGLSIAIAVFIWLKSFANINPVPDCKAETSLIIEDYLCREDYINISVKNNGLFNIDGFMATISDDARRFPIINLKTKDDQRIPLPSGNYVFNESLKPGSSMTAKFEKQTGIKVIRIQPFILDEKNIKIVCSQADIKQEIQC